MDNKNNISVDGKFQTYSDIEHVKKHPQIYVGNNNNINKKMWLLKNNIFELKNINYNKAFVHLFRELVDNAYDNQFINKEESSILYNEKMTEIRVIIDKQNSIISVYNDGINISLIKDKNFGKYIPEIIFAVLRSSSNYKKNIKKVTSGSHGLGAKLTNILSLKFKTEIVNKGEKYTQIWSGGISIKGPIIEKIKNKKISYIKICYLPNYKYFHGLNKLTNECYKIMEKFIYDKACCCPTIKVYFQNKLIKTNTFKKYLLYFNTKINPIFYNINNFELAITRNDSEDNIKCYYFVNSIVSTNEESSIMKTIINQVCTYIKKNIIKKTKKKCKPRIPTIKKYLFIFCNAVIYNAKFEEQTKKILTTPPKEFGFDYILPNSYLKKLSLKLKIEESIITEFEKNAQPKIKNTERKKHINKSNVVHARYAGHKDHKKALKCSLVITEGQSASTLVLKSIPALPEGERDYFGVYSLTGKVLNVKKASKDKIIKNKVLNELMSNLGLEVGITNYEEIRKSLRYGQIIMMCDQDSVSGDTPLLLKNNNNKIVIKNIEDLTNNFIKNNSFAKEYGQSDYKVWTDKGWSDIKNIMRHKINKKMYRVLTHKGCIDVTEDHSLLNLKGEKIKPIECKIGNKLLHSYPLFEENKINIPNNIDHLKVKELYLYASKLRIRYYQKLKKDELLKIIKTYKNNNFENLCDDNNINIEEAYVMGLFFADGSCGVYKWKYKKNPINRPNEYIFNRISYSWHIDNTDSYLLNKSLIILNKIYGNYFKIIKIKSAKNCKPMSRIILNGGKKTKYIIEKYRKYFYYKKYKYLHEDILNSKKDIREQIYKGYYDGDGLHYSKRTNQFDVNGKITSQCIYFLCKSLGYSVSINHQIKKEKIYSFLASKGFYRKNSNIIKKIIKLNVKEQYVYDLETENHHFQAGVGSLIVHNTDGYHIKGLIINYIHTFWPELLKNNYIKFFATNIVVATHKKTKQKINFMSEYKYELWGKKNIKSEYSIKFYKGLATSSAKEGYQYFSNITNYLKYLCYNNEDDFLFIKKAFNKDSNFRKKWINEFTNNDYIDYNLNKISYKDLINKELRQFFKDDLYRSIPNIMDGLKPSQRKILFGCFKKGITSNKEVKVYQLTGYVAEHAAYHHGDTSLNETIIHMAQNYVGSNNINLLVPSGMFGSRRGSDKGIGKDFGSPRYICTSLNKITRNIFLISDDKILNYLQEDGISIEPNFYIPILPMCLINGAKGIGTGWSTTILNYNPKEILMLIIKIFKGEDIKKYNNLIPYYKGWNGTFEIINGGYKSKGTYKEMDSFKYEILELPIGLSITKFAESLGKLSNNSIIKSFYINYGGKKKKIKKINNEDKDVVNYIITFNKNKIDKNGIIKTLDKLLTTILKTTNMVLFDKNNKIKKYSTTNEIIEEFVKYRIKYYKIRKDYQIKNLNYKLIILKNQIKYIQEIIQGTIKVKGMIYEKTFKLLEFKKYYKNINFNNKKVYSYIMNLTFYDCTKENIEKKKKLIQKLEKELILVKQLTEIKMYLSDLINLNKLL